MNKHIVIIIIMNLPCYNSLQSECSFTVLGGQKLLALSVVCAERCLGV